MPGNIVFDVGNVLLRWDPRFLFRKLFDDEARMEWFLANVFTPAHNLECDRGRGFADTVAELCARFPDFAPAIRAFDERWSEMVPGEIGKTLPVVNKELVRDLLPDLLTTGGYALEKVEGFTIDASGEGFAVTDNDGVNDSNGESLFWSVGKF